MIGIICATDDEILHLIDDLTEKEEMKVGLRTFYKGKLYSRDAVLVRSNVGKAAASAAAALIVSVFDVKAIVFAGTAGGLAEGLALGDVVVAKSLVQHDFRLFGEYPAKIPYLGKAYFDCDKSLSEKAYNAAVSYFSDCFSSDIPDDVKKRFGLKSPEVKRGIIASGDEFISDPVKKASINRETGAICAEMEGAAAAQTAYELSVPIAVIRIISDCADENGESSYNSFVEKASSLLTRGILKKLLSDNAF